MKKFLISGLLSLMVLLCVVPAYAYEDVKYDNLHRVATASADGTLVNTERFASIGLQVVITGTAVVTPQVTIDGETFVAAQCTSQTITASGIYYCDVSATKSFKAPLAYTSGNVTVNSVITTANVNILRGLGDGSAASGSFKFNSSNDLAVYLGKCMSGESICNGTDPNSYLKVTGAVVRSAQVMTDVTTNTSSVTFTLPTGSKTVEGNVDGTGAVSVTLALYGDPTSTAEDTNLICSIPLSGTTRSIGACAPFTTNFAFYHFKTTAISGTGAAVDAKVNY